MSFDPSFEEQELLAETVELAAARMTQRELASGRLLAAGFAAAVVAVWLLMPPRAFTAVPALVCLAVLVLAMRVSFDTPFGQGTATQLGFVPLLFAVPPAIVPIAVALAMAIAWLPDVRSGELRPTRLLQVPGNCWFAVGPVVVLALTHTDPRRAGRRAAGRGTRGAVRGRLLRLLAALRRDPRRQRRLGAALELGVRHRRRSLRRRTGRGRGRPLGTAGRALAGAAARPARPVRQGAPPAPGEHARAIQRLPRHRAGARRRHRGGRRLHRRALQERGQPHARTRRAPGPRAPSASATSSSPRSCTTSARSPSPRRSSTSPASSTPTSGRSSRPTPSRARRCSTASAASCARSA